MWAILAMLQTPEEKRDIQQRVDAAVRAFNDLWRVMWTNGGCLVVVIAFALIIVAVWFWDLTRWAVQYRYGKDEEWTTLTRTDLSSGPIMQFSIRSPLIGPATYKFSEAKTIAKQWEREHSGAEVRTIWARKVKD
jgi:hypothetical protein